MQKIRLTPSEWKEMLKDISDKYHMDCKKNISEFSYTKTDVTNFLKETINKEVTLPVIQITTDAYVKMYELVKQSPVEIQWHGLVERHGDGTYTIFDILVFPQTNSSAHTSSDQNEFAEWQTKLIMDPNFPIEKMRLHGHSHVNMNVYSSSIDDGYQSELITKVDDGDYYIFLVLNKRMEMYPLLYDFDQQILFQGEDITIQILDQTGHDISVWATQQINTNCKTTPAYAKKSWGISQKTNLELERMQYEDYIAEVHQSTKGIKKKNSFRR